MDTCLNYTNDRYAFFSTDEKKWIKKIYEIMKDHPDEIEIIKKPEDNEGCLYARLPTKYFKLSAPKKRSLTEEQIEAARERGRRLAETRKEKFRKNDDNEIRE